MKQGYDVVVAGAGNAAFCAALAACERVGCVLMLEKAPRAWIGGNTYFTAGAFRTTFSDVEDLSPILDDVAQEQLARTELPPYTEDDFVADMNRVTEDCCDDELTNILASEAADAVRWLHGKGIRWRLMYDRQSFEVGGKRRFWGASPRNGGRRQRARTTAPRRQDGGSPGRLGGNGCGIQRRGVSGGLRPDDQGRQAYGGYRATYGFLEKYVGREGENG
jgi:succinate dehydrogenase/fumarate reductase flavoprotein subunit